MGFKKVFFFIRKNKAVSIIILLLIFALAYYLYTHRKPFTQNAFVVANVHPVTAFISGYITHIYVENNSEVKKGDKILTVYKRPYELQVQILKKQIEAAEWQVKSLNYDMEAAKHKIVQVKADLENADYLSDQATLLFKKKAVSQKHAEILEKEKESLAAKLAETRASFASYEAKKAKEQATVESLKAHLEKAEVELFLTTVYALNDGIISNMYLTEGAYVNAGSTLFAFTSNKDWWIQANFKETELSEIREGQKAKIWLWQYPGKVFKGVVGEIGWGVDRRFSEESTGMSVVKKENEWFLLPQRFPVQIKILDFDPQYPLHLGASAFVEVETRARPIRQFFWQMFQM